MPNASNRKELTHDRILGVASRALRRSGYGGAGLATIMKEAGLTLGGFYAHFRSRDALLAEATQRAGRDTAAVLAERLRHAQAPGSEPVCRAGSDMEVPPRTEAASLVWPPLQSCEGT
ncbi:MAG: hypothetical protein RL722_2868 [Pseudomonadota bacterium]